MGITGDGVSTNRTMWNILGVSGKVDKFKNTFITVNYKILHNMSNSDF